MSSLPPIPMTFTPVVASREFDLVQTGVRQKLVIEIGMPIQDVETINGYDWRCPVRIRHGDTLRERRACGVDSFQALQLAMRLMQDEVEQIAQAEGWHIELFRSPYVAGAF
jgi:hypothetical protein